MTVPRRRFHRFSLRTLFAAVTACALSLGWLGYQLNWIRARHHYLDERGMLPLGSNSKAAPWCLRVFGESGAALVGAANDEQLPAVQALFPESSVAMPTSLPITLEDLGAGD
jgi:hypothetical protein